MVAIECKTRKWGNSLGILISKKEAKESNLTEDQDIVIEVTEIKNPLRELFGFGKNKKITPELFKQVRQLLEPRQ
ncbi:MAG: hypothetical protein Q7K43_05390 [Candidatus Woesearchaeota archaeon]|nr:hypothetical protein [Candidatus Woesearchaeota archaeon]